SSRYYPGTNGGAAVRFLARKESGGESVGDVLRAAFFANRQVDLLPCLVRGRIGVLVESGFAFKFDGEDGVVLGGLYFHLLQPYVFDARRFAGHVLDAFNRGSLLLFGCVR